MVRMRVSGSIVVWDKVILCPIAPLICKIKEVKRKKGRTEVRIIEKGRQWRLSGLLYEDDSFVWRVGR